MLLLHFSSERFTIKRVDARLLRLSYPGLPATLTREVAVHFTVIVQRAREWIFLDAVNLTPPCAVLAPPGVVEGASACGVGPFRFAFLGSWEGAIGRASAKSVATIEATARCAQRKFGAAGVASPDEGGWSTRGRGWRDGERGRKERGGDGGKWRSRGDCYGW